MKPCGVFMPGGAKAMGDICGAMGMPLNCTAAQCLPELLFMSLALWPGRPLSDGAPSSIVHHLSSCPLVQLGCALRPRLKTSQYRCMTFKQVAC